MFCLWCLVYVSFWAGFCDFGDDLVLFVVWWLSGGGFDALIVLV